MQTPSFDPKKIAVLGVPSSAGTRDPGQEKTPALFRRSGLIERLRYAGLDVRDLGDLAEAYFDVRPGDASCRNLNSVVAVVRQVADAVDQAMDAQARLLVIGGDCTITIGVVAGLVRRLESLGLMYLDGDLDLNTPETTPSGFLDGMGLAHIVGLGAHDLSHAGPRHPLVPERNVTAFGYSEEAGGIDPAELQLLGRSSLKRYPKREIQSDIAAHARTALKDLESRAENILVHFDIDVVDFAELPVTKLPHSPGLSLDDARQALEIFLRARKTAGLVVTEFDAECDSDGRWSHKLIEILAAALAQASR